MTWKKCADDEPVPENAVRVVVPADADGFLLASELMLTPPMIEDDLNAHPAQLRAEIRRLRKWVPQPDYGRVPEDTAVLVMAQFLCPLRDGACACPGTCRERAREIMAELKREGLLIAPAARGGEERT